MKLSLLIVVCFLFLIGLLFWAFTVQDDSERARCSDSGGSIVEIHGGRGGWFCQR